MVIETTGLADPAPIIQTFRSIQVLFDMRACISLSEAHITVTGSFEHPTAAMQCRAVFYEVHLNLRVLESIYGVHLLTWSMSVEESLVCSMWLKTTPWMAC